jgi:hypothetical protein
MTKIEQLLTSIRAVIEKADDELDLSAFPEADYLREQIAAYEKQIAKLLRKQKRYFVDGLNSYVAKDENMDALMNYMGALFVADTFSEEISQITIDMLKTTIPALTSKIMGSIDKDVVFSVTSKRTADWIEEWSPKLGEIMKLTSHTAVEEALKTGIKSGEGIPKIVERLKDLPEFDRNRAETTAITEILTASSRANWEAMQQSSAVTGRTWLHSGSKGIQPRPHHVAYSGTTIGMDEQYSIGGSNCDYPRDPNLPAKERVRCHCVEVPQVDADILKMSKEEKEKIREERIKQLGGYAE